MEQKVVIGVDEAGRGAFLSRIYSAAFVCDMDLCSRASANKVVIRDSKKMTPRQRQVSYQFLVENGRFGVGYCDEKEIDELGISRCNILSMHRSIDDLLSRHPALEIEKIRVDGVLFEPYLDIPYELVVRGESAHPEIAMASILAKTHRDHFVVSLCEEYPDLDEKYAIRSNKGYGTAKHIEGIRRHGIHDLHRKTFVRNHHHSLRFL
jgi:ribonuclease HII